MFYFPYTLAIRSLLLAFMKLGDMLMVIAFFDRREHLGGKNVHSNGDDHPKCALTSR